MPFLDTADGRRLAYEEQGDPGGLSVFVIHGTPGSRLIGLHPDPERVRAAGLRLITYDRPGYGASTRHHGRRVVDCTPDIAAIADELRLETFAVTGSSGGGPHALAAAARLAERVTRAECNVGVVPYDAADIDFFEGMDPENVTEFGWALAGEPTLAAELESAATKARAQLDADPAALFGDFELSDADRAVLARQDVQEVFRAGLREALAQGAIGWVDDDLAFTEPWGFDVSEIRVPVHVRYGVTDVLVPAAHGAWLGANVPGATVTADTESGHMSTPDEVLDRIQEFAR